MTATDARLWSFGKSLLRQGMPAGWQDMDAEDVDNDYCAWPLDSGNPCQNDGGTPTGV